MWGRISVGIAAALLSAASIPAAAAGAAPGEPTVEPHAETKKDEGVIDAEYVDVDEKKS